MRRPKNTESDVMQPSAPVDDTPPVDVISAPVPPVDETAETAPQVIEVVPPLEPPAHVRIGGVRVQQSGLTQQKRVTGANDDLGAADHRPVPLAVLEQVKELLYAERQEAEQLMMLNPLETLRAVRDLLDPWL